VAPLFEVNTVCCFKVRIHFAAGCTTDTHKVRFRILASVSSVTSVLWL